MLRKKAFVFTITVMVIGGLISQVMASERLVVRNLTGRNFSQDKAVLLTNLLISNLESTGEFDIFSRPEILDVLSRDAEARKMDPECTSTQCILNLGVALGANRLLTGEVGRLGNTYIIVMSLYDIAGGRRQDRKTWAFSGTEDELIDRIVSYGQEILGLTVKPEPMVEEAAEKPKVVKKTLSFEFMRIPGGEFMMGLEDGSKETPVHQVRVDDFYLGMYEVTQAQWREVLGNNPSHFSGCDDCPVEKVSWTDVQDFLDKASRMTGMKLRLPTEAEWEYAAGGGAAHQKWAGTDVGEELEAYAWYDRNSDGRTHPVGLRKPNLFGLYDMSGNVAEWCSDWYDEEYYSRSPADNPKGPPSGDSRVLRGGSWYFSSLAARVTSRLKHGPSDQLNINGFRIARDVDSEPGE